MSKRNQFNNKNKWSTLGLILFAAFSFSCQKDKSSNDNNNNGGAAVVPGISCMDGTTNCNGQAYSQYQGFQPYGMNPYNYGGYSPYWNQNYGQWSQWGNNYAGLCNCPANTIPTYNNYYGLGCVQNTYFQPTLYFYAYWGWGPNNNQWTNIPQVSNIRDYSVQNQSCYSGVVQSCFIDIANSCGAGYVCQPTSGGSRLGLCSNPNQVYNSPYGYGR